VDAAAVTLRGVEWERFGEAWRCRDSNQPCQRSFRFEAQKSGRCTLHCIRGLQRTPSDSGELVAGRQSLEELDPQSVFKRSDSSCDSGMVDS
jgi:hypothetical protein